MAARYIFTVTLALMWVPSMALAELDSAAESAAESVTGSESATESESESEAESESWNLKWMVSGLAGVGFLGSDIDGTTIGNPRLDIGGSVGLQAGDLIRWDTVEVSWLGTAKNNPYVPAIYDMSILSIGSGVRVGYFGPRWSVHPYASVGLGAAGVTLDDSTGRLVQWNIEWSAGAGFDVPVTDQVSMGARYLYRGTPNDLIAAGAMLSTHTIAVELIFIGL